MMQQLAMRLIKKDPVTKNRTLVWKSARSEDLVII